MKTYTLKVGDIIVYANRTAPDIGYTEIGKIEKVAIKTATCSNIGKVGIEASVWGDGSIILKTAKGKRSMFVLNDALIDSLAEAKFNEEFYQERKKISRNDIDNMSSDQMQKLLLLIPNYPEWLKSVAKAAVGQISEINIQDRLEALKGLSAIVKQPNKIDQNETK